MPHPGPVLLAILCLIAPVFARHETSACGTHLESAAETIFLHKQALRSRGRSAFLPRVAPGPHTTVTHDAGDIAIIEDTDGVVARQNEFSLDFKTLTFVLAGTAAYRYAVSEQGYDSTAAASGIPLAALDDDDARSVSIPFAFPFFGATYTQVFVNSDGNLTFVSSDTASADRSLGRTTAGPPRISPLFDDLDPSRSPGGVRVLAEPNRMVVSWVSVPEWQSSGAGRQQTFQVKLYPDGRIEFSYSGTAPADAIVGIAPGMLARGSSLVDFRNDTSGTYTGAISERFGNSLSLDIVTVAQKFYSTHEDAYDYLVIYNNLGISATAGAVAYEATARSSGSGYGIAKQDNGTQYGSQSRLSAVLNLGPLDQYPADPAALVPLRAQAGDTPTTVIAHEAGHLFLAYASVRDPNNPAAKPMLGYQNAHWSFLFNSEASLLEGERIQDRGSDVHPRFLTTGTVEAYAPLDQYLMGFRPANDVPPTFLVQPSLSISTDPSGLANLHPVKGFSIDGARRDIAIDEIVQVMGRRTPDHTIAQRRFRFAFILVTAAGSEPSAADTSKVEGYRKSFETFFGQAASRNASADTTLRRSMKLSLFPAAGVVEGGSIPATLTVTSPSVSGMTVQFQSTGTYARFPDTVTIPPNATSVTFMVTGTRGGVEEVTAVPSDPSYETAFARVQVANASVLKLENVSGTATGAIAVRLVDANGLTYSGAKLMATASPGGTVLPLTAITGADGTANFTWSPGVSTSNRLDLALDGMPSVTLQFQSGGDIPLITGVTNGASFEAGVAAGAIESLFGSNFAPGRTPAASDIGASSLNGVQVLLDGSALELLYVSDGQINFFVPANVQPGNSTLTAISATGVHASVDVTVKAIQPGIFSGGIVRAGTTEDAATTAVRPGDYLEIYCTGLGATRTANGLSVTVVTPTVFIGVIPIQPLFSGLVSSKGLYQVNVQVPSGLASGPQPVILSSGQVHSNQVPIAIQ